MRRERTIRVYEVSWTDLADGTDAGPGPMGDGFRTARFRSERDAMAYAKGKCLWGKPASVDVTDAPYRVASRWGLA